ncbi:antitoxin [Bacillus piscicola]|uniref:antitoxin n=1 Tax=Bacillus piscicola TaxID=1632684 RepID=UPI001F098083|nr:antitoxin [Bacillus piscicola]
MSQLQQIEVELSEHLYSEIEHLSKEEKDSFFREALQEEIRQRKAADLRNQMKQGYLEMAQINAELCKEFERAEEEALRTGERAVISAK